MNKKEINEIKRIFSDDCGLFTVNHVDTAVDVNGIGIKMDGVANG
jgi:hypothetical protein